MIDDEVIEAMKEGARVYVDMSELHNKAGAFIAKLTGAEAAYVSAGAAAGLVLSVAACMTRGNADLMSKLPRSDGTKNEVIVQKIHRNMYDHNLELAGATIREIGSENGTAPEDLENANTDKTAAVVYFAYDPQEGVLPLSAVIEISHRRGIPVIVDAAAELPPKDNLLKFVGMKADLVLFSGGKDIGGPNDTGIILGKRELVELCMRLGPQSYEKTDSRLRVYIGRPMKTSKEDILAITAATKRYLETDHDQRMQVWEKKIQYMIQRLTKCKALEVRRVVPGFGHNRPACIPRVEIEILDGRLAVDDMASKLKHGVPPIYTYTMNDRLYINPQCLQHGEEAIVVKNIIKLLS